MEKQIQKTNSKNGMPKRADGASIFLVIFALLFVAMIGRSLVGGANMPGILGGNNKPEPVELTFSDVLNRAPEIKTMNIRGANATGELDDGTPYTATITYDPDLLGQIAENGATISKPE